MCEMNGSETGGEVAGGKGGRNEENWAIAVEPVQ